MIDLKYIITATGRCGTVYLAKVLCSLGIICGHESIFTPEGYETAIKIIKKGCPKNASKRSNEYEKNWLGDKSKIVADSSFMAAPFLDKFPNTTIIHVVRNPIQVIFSFVKDFHYFENPHLPSEHQKFILAHSPIDLSTSSPLEAAMQYYVFWNSMIEQVPNRVFFRIEDNIEQLTDKLNLSCQDIYLDKKTNTAKHRIEQETLDDLPDCQAKENLVEMANRYGYDLNFNKGKKVYLYL